MPGNRLPFTVRVRSEEDFVGLFRFLLDLRQDLGLAFDRHVLRLEIVLEVHAQFAGRQILDVADRSHHGIPSPKIFGDRFGFGRRLNDDQ